MVNEVLDADKELKSIDIFAEDHQRLVNFYGQYNEHLQQIERHLGVEINQRGGRLQIIGLAPSVELARDILLRLYKETLSGEQLTAAKVHVFLQGVQAYSSSKHVLPSTEGVPTIQTPQCVVKPRTPNQLLYVNNIKSHDINFGIGPAGTGKTYLAVACAVSALERDEIKRLILVRPAVEAGERLGFLPGDMAQKVDPYLRPIYDALYEMLGFDRVSKYIERGMIEIAPLAFMRGRTLSDSFIILDESQNTTKEQMKMFLTRIGFGSKVVITGDITQVDLPKQIESGLRHAIALLKDVSDIGFTFLQRSDVVRHALVQRIIEAYEYAESQKT